MTFDAEEVRKPSNEGITSIFSAEEMSFPNLGSQVMAVYNYNPYYGNNSNTQFKKPSHGGMWLNHYIPYSGNSTTKSS
jgi:hypothetical protein